MNIAVVIPAFNAERYVARAVDTALRQTLPPTQIIVVDDGSRDDTARIVERFGSPVACIRQDNRGVSAARNSGASVAVTDWIAFLDADDEWLPTKLDRQRAALGAGGDACCTALRVIYEGTGVFEDAGVDAVDTDLASLLFHRGSIPPGTSSTLLVRRDVFRKIGGYDERLSTSADWDLLLRLRIATSFRYVPEPLVLYRRHAMNMSRNVEVLDRDTRLVLEKAFAAPELPAEFRGLRRRCLAWNALVLAGSYSRVGRWDRALALGLRAVCADPTLATRAIGFPARRLRRALTGARELDTVAGRVRP